MKPYVHQAASVMEHAGSYSLREIPVERARNDCSVVTLMSANLWHDWPLYRRLPERLQAFAQLVETEQIDILLVQEVAKTPNLHSDEWLADRLGMAYIYSRANGHKEVGFEEGLAVLSRFPLRDPQVKQLSSARNPFVRRLAVGATIGTPCGDLSAFSVHLGLFPRDNREQYTQLRKLVNGTTCGQPVIVGGDFNSDESAQQIEQSKTEWLDTYRHLYPDGDAHTHSLRMPWGGALNRRRLDYIFLHSPRPEWQVLETRHVTTPGKPHSDHHAVLTRLAPLN